MRPQVSRGGRRDRSRARLRGLVAGAALGALLFTTPARGQGYPDCPALYPSLGAFPSTSFVIDTDALTWDGNAGGVVVGGRAVFAFDSIVVGFGKTVTATGSRPLVLLSHGGIAIAGVLQLSGGDSSGSATPTVGAGGGVGGTQAFPTGGAPAGGIQGVAQGGSGGGGLGGKGGNGGTGSVGAPGVGGAVAGNLATALTGGSGGAAGTGGAPNTAGGSGGGALLLVATTQIFMDVSGQVLAKGGSVLVASAGTGGAGGGSGGGIVLLAPAVHHFGTVSANGGDGGSAAGVGSGSGGGGGGGRIIIESTSPPSTGSGAVTANAGAGSPAFGPGQNGQLGVVQIDPGLFGPPCGLLVDGFETGTLGAWSANAGG